jgi:DNA-binding XRE family transcriptional regulator
MAKYHSEERRNLQKFFRERPSISKQGFANEVGISRQYLNLILNGKRRFTESARKKMRPVLFKYGCQHPVAGEDFQDGHKCPTCGQLTKIRTISLN